MTNSIHGSGEKCGEVNIVLETEEEFPETVPQPSDIESLKTRLNDLLFHETSESSSDSSKMSVLSWLLDFAFRDLRLPVINLWVCRIVYALCWIVAVGVLIYWTLGSLIWGLASSHESFRGIDECVLSLVVMWIAVAVFILAARLLCEWYILLFDWIVATTQAARLFVDEHKMK